MYNRNNSHGSRAPSITDPTTQESDRLLLAKELQDGLWPYVSYQVRGKLRVGGWGDAARSSFYKQGSERSCRGTQKLSAIQRDVVCCSRFVLHAFVV